MKCRTLLILALTLSISTVAFSEPGGHPYDEQGRPNPDAFDWTGVALGANIGTLGFGADVSVYLGPQFNFRTVASLLPYDYENEVDDIDFDVELDFTTLRFLIDFFPSDTGAFRISAGLVYADNSVGVKAVPNVPTTIGDHKYTPGEIGTISGDLTFDDWSPYIGIGFGNPVRPDTAFSAAVDLGVMFQSYETTLTADGTKAGNPTFESDLDSLEQDVDDELNNFKVYPVITVSLSYHF